MSQFDADGSDASSFPKIKVRIESLSDLVFGLEAEKSLLET